MLSVAAPARCPVSRACFPGATRSTIYAHGMRIGAGGAHYLVKTDHTDDASNVPVPPDAPAPREKIEKTSYEASEQVQRWLREQAAERIGANPPSTPTSLAHQPHPLCALSSLH